MAFQGAMQCHLEAVTSFIISNQPHVVLSLHQDPPAQEPPSLEAAPAYPFAGCVPSPLGHVEEHPPVLQPVPSLHPEDISLAPSLPPSALVSSQDDSSVLECEFSHKDPFESSVLEGFSLSSIGSTLGPRPVAAIPSQHEGYLWLMV